MFPQILTQLSSEHLDKVLK